MCEYSQQDFKENYIFSYTHDQQNKKSIAEVLEERGIAEEDYHRLLVILNPDNKSLGTSFLHLPDIFDGSVSPNDFPVKVYLREKWKGSCEVKWNQGDKESLCLAVRSMLFDACDGKNVDELCTYKTLKNERKRLGKVVQKYGFEGKCARSGENVLWCKLSTQKEQAIEACLHKPVGKSCWYHTDGTGRANMMQGICQGDLGGKALSCNGAPVAYTDACEGKPLGADCESKSPPIKGMCGYSTSSLLCMGAEPAPTPEPATTPAPAHADEELRKEVSSMHALLTKVAEKINVGKEGRRRRRRSL